MKKPFLIAVAAELFTLSTCTLAEAACSFTTAKKTMTLNGDCTTDTSIIVPNGITLDGVGHTITAVDPISGHFTGGVIQNGGATANVTNVTITTSGLVEPVGCDEDPVTRLRGILFD